MTRSGNSKGKSRRLQGRSAADRSFPFQSQTSPDQEAFLDETIDFWQPYSERQLTREDAREMVENITGFFSVLLEWRTQARSADRKQVAESDSKKTIADDSAARQTRFNELPEQVFGLTHEKESAR